MEPDLPADANLILPHGTVKKLGRNWPTGTDTCHVKAIVSPMVILHWSDCIRLNAASEAQ